MLAIINLLEIELDPSTITTERDLVRWGKSKGVIPRESRSYPTLLDGEFKVRMRKSLKKKGINPKTGRMKNKKITRYLVTKIRPEDRTLKNLPRDSQKKSKVTFREWLQIDGHKRTLKSNTESWGWAANGKCYGWSHRAVFGWGIGDEITSKVSGFDRLEKSFIIKSNEKCEEVAKKFAESVS